MSGLCPYSFPQLRMAYSMIVGVFGRVPWNYWVIFCLRCVFICIFFLSKNRSLVIHIILFRLPEPLGKPFWKAVVMMKVLVLKLMDVLLLKFLEKKNVMRFLLHCIWFVQMSALLYARYCSWNLYFDFHCQICCFSVSIWHCNSMLLYSGCTACVENHSCKYSKNTQGNHASFNEHINHFSGFIIFGEATGYFSMLSNVIYQISAV